MFLGLHYVSEICTIDGISFAPEILEEDASQLSYQITLKKTHIKKDQVTAAGGYEKGY